MPHKITGINQKVLTLFGALTLFFISTDVLSYIYNFGLKSGTMLRSIL